MRQKNENVGFEVVCNAGGCVHNDCPICKVHTVKSPVVIGPFGLCKKYESEGAIPPEGT